MEISMIVALVVFIITYVIISTEIFHKTIAVLLGSGIFMLVSGFLPEGNKILDQASMFTEHVDWNVIFLLLSMMIIVGIVKKTGLTQYIAIKAAKAAKGEPVVIMILFIWITALFSALLGTVTTILLIVPVSLLLSVEMSINPLPFIITQAMAANIGGCATLVGDATTIMIGSRFKLDFLDYMKLVDPILGLLLIILSIFAYLVFHKKMNVSNERKARILDFDESRAIENKPLLIKSLIIIALVILGFIFHTPLQVEVATVALFGAAVLMLLAGGHELEGYFAEVEWPTIFFFVGLFGLVGGVVDVGLIDALGNWLIGLTGGDVGITSILIIWASGIISAVVDNVPYVATMAPLIEKMGSAMNLAGPALTPLWLTLLLGADLGGNGSMVGATANVVALGIAGKNGHKITFWDFTKYGIVITLINLTLVTAIVFFFFLPRV